MSVGDHIYRKFTQLSTRQQHKADAEGWSISWIIWVMAWHKRSTSPLAFAFFFKFKERPLEVNLWNQKKPGKIEGDIQVRVKTGRRIIRDQVDRRPWSVCLKLCVVSWESGMMHQFCQFHICPLWWLLKTCQVGSRCSRATRFLMKRVHSLRTCCP